MKEVSNEFYENMCFDVTKRVQDNGYDQMNQLRKMYQTLSEEDLHMITEDNPNKFKNTNFGE